MGYNLDRINEALVDKKLIHLKKPYLKLDKILTNNQRASIKKKIKHTTPGGFSELLISYFLMYNISYSDAPVRLRTPEDKKKVSKRQKEFVERQKNNNKKKIQVYISERDYEMLVKIKGIKNSTFGGVISSLIRSKYYEFPANAK